MSKKIPLLIAIFFNLYANSYAQSCTGYVTYTQGAWGAVASGNNIGNYLNANFAAAFPNGLEIGCTNKLKLTSSTAIRDFLPQSTTPKALPPGTLTDPNSNNYKNILAGQLVTLALNIGFDNYDPNFAPASDNLQDLVIVTGPFANWTVGDLFSEANKKIGGCTSNNNSYAAFNDAINNININYDKGLSNLNFLSCQLHLTFCKNNVSCNGLFDGGINLTVHNGNAPYSYLWSNGATTEDLSNLSAGNYTVVVTDASGHTATASVTISQPAAIVINSNSTDVTCFGNNNGSASVNVSGGNAPYTYNWSNGNTTSSTTNLTAGVYTIVISDDNGCSNSNTISINEPSQLMVSANVQSINCYGSNNGSISIQTSGGTAPYNYNWNNGDTTNTLYGLSGGNYTAIITDANTCSASINVQITEPTPLILNGNKTDSYACDEFVCDGTADITIQGGIQPYQILWSEGSTNTTSLVNLCPTPQLVVTVTDNNGCNVQYDFNGIECKQCDTLTTYTQNTWGEIPNGNNLGTYLHNNFSNAFPAGLTIGCNNLLTLTNAQAITDWLPKTGTPALLPTGTITDDTTYDNSFAAQLVTAKLNTGFDAYDFDFNPSTDYLGNRFFTSGLYAGYTLDQVIEEASNAIGGCVPNFFLAELNFALNAANQNYEDGTHSNGYLVCRFIAAIRYADTENNSIKLNALYPNPCADIVNASIKVSEDTDVKIEIIDMLGQVVYSRTEFVNAGTSAISINTKNFESQVYIIRINNGHNTCSSMLMVK